MDFGQSAESEVTAIAAACVAALPWTQSSSFIDNERQAVEVCTYRGNDAAQN